MFHPVQQTNGSFVGFAGVRCYFLGFCFLSREKKILYAKKRVYERKSKCQFDEKMNEIVFGVCVEQLSRQLWHSWIWFAVANWLGLWILTVFCFLVCLISITFFSFFNFFNLRCVRWLMLWHFLFLIHHCSMDVGGLYGEYLIFIFPPISTNVEVDNKMCWGKRSKTTQQREYLYKK